MVEGGDGRSEWWMGVRKGGGEGGRERRGRGGRREYGKEVRGRGGEGRGKQDRQGDHVKINKQSNCARTVVVTH